MEGWTFNSERLEAVLPEVQALWALHWKETEGYRDALGYNPDLKAFVAYDRGGMFRLFTVRDEVGRLMGQIGFIVFPSHHTQQKTAGEDFWYVRKEARGRGIARKLLSFAVEALRQEEVRHITLTDKLPSDLGPLVKPLGFEFVARQYSLVLKEV